MAESKLNIDLKLMKFLLLKIVKSVKTTGNEELSWTCGKLPRVNMSY